MIFYRDLPRFWMIIFSYFFYESHLRSLLFLVVGISQQASFPSHVSVDPYSFQLMMFVYDASLMIPVSKFHREVHWFVFLSEHFIWSTIGFAILLLWGVSFIFRLFLCVLKWSLPHFSQRSSLLYSLFFPQTGLWAALVIYYGSSLCPLIISLYFQDSFSLASAPSERYPPVPGTLSHIFIFRCLPNFAIF